MDLNPGPEYQGFRDQVKSFLNENSQMAGRVRNPARPSKDELEWQKKLIEKGYSARTIPTEYGGYGAESDVLKSRIISEEFTGVNSTIGIANQGISMLVPTLLGLGTEE